MKKIIISFALIMSLNTIAQNAGKVGINTRNPTETLHVNGIAHADLLYLRSPGEPLELPINFMASETFNLDVYDPTLENSSLVNLLNLNFENIPDTGITSYNTKINATNFIAAVRSFSLAKYVSGATGSIDVYTTHTSNTTANQTNVFQGSPDFVCYVAPTNPNDVNSEKTWWVRARYLDSRFTENDGTFRSGDRYTIKLQLLVYKKLITKYIDQTQNINLGGTTGNSPSYVIPKPSGF